MRYGLGVDQAAVTKTCPWSPELGPPIITKQIA